MATFLWRIMGEPAATTPAPFGDVAAGRFYTDAVAWLAQAGVTTGLTPSRFGPDGTVTRAQMATFLWRLVGEPTPPVDDGFNDVDRDAWYGDGVAWLAAESVTTGVAPGVFAPDGAVTRDQMAAFLCRLSRTDAYAARGAVPPVC